MTTARWIKLVGVLLAVGLAVLFWIQNSTRLSELSLDLYFFGFQLGQPLPVPTLLFAALGLGLVVGGGWGLAMVYATQRRVRELEDEVARASLSSRSDDWT